MYGIEFWHCTYNSHIQYLKKILNKLITYVLHKYVSNKHYHNIHSTLNVQELNQIFKKCLLLFLFSFEHMLNPYSYSYTTRHSKHSN